MLGAVVRPFAKLGYRTSVANVALLLAVLLIVCAGTCLQPIAAYAQSTSEALAPGQVASGVSPQADDGDAQSATKMLTLGQTVTGQQEVVGDYNLYTFVPEEDGQYIFEVAGPQGGELELANGLNPFLRVDWVSYATTDMSGMEEDGGVLVNPWSIAVPGRSAVECTLVGDGKHKYEFHVFLSSDSSGTFEYSVTVRKPRKVIVTLDANGGTFEDGSTTEQVELRENVFNTPSKYVETFAFADYEPRMAGKKVYGWDRDAGSSDPRFNFKWGVISKKYSQYGVFEAETLYALWDDGAVVTFDANGGTGGPAPVTVFLNEYSREENDCIPTREGYAFLGWSKRANATKPDSKAMTSPDWIHGTWWNEFGQDTTLYAVWASAWRVSFDGNGSACALGTRLVPKERGLSLNYDELPMRDGYMLLGWSTDSGATETQFSKSYIEPESDVKLYAVWAEEMDIVYHYCPRNYTDEIAAGDYSWIGSSSDSPWYETEGKGQQHWIIGGYDSQPATRALAGWCKTAEMDRVDYYPGQSITVTEPLDLYPVFADAVKVTFDLNSQSAEWRWESGDDARAQKVYYWAEGSTQVMTDDVRYEEDEQGRGAELLGYATDPSAELPDVPADAKTDNATMTVPDADTTYYAVWRLWPGLTFDANGGNFVSDEGAGIDYPLYLNPGWTLDSWRWPEPRRSGYRFLGFAATADAAEPEYAYDDMNSRCTPDYVFGTQDAVLYAVWEALPSVTLDANGGMYGTGDSAQPTKVLTDGDDGGRVNLNDVRLPEREGYVFLGYANEPDAEQAEYPYSWDEREFSTYRVRFSESMTLYALWKKAPVVTFHANDGSGDVRAITAQWSTYLGGMALENRWGTTYYEPEREGYAFAGWATTADATEPDPRWHLNCGLALGKLTEDLEFFALWERVPTDARLVPDGGMLVQGKDFELLRGAVEITGRELTEQVVEFNAFPAKGDALELTYSDGLTQIATYDGEQFVFADGKPIPWSLHLYGTQWPECVQWLWPGEYAADGSIKSLKQDVVDSREITFTLSGGYLDEMTRTQAVNVKWAGSPKLELTFWDAGGTVGRPLYVHPGETFDMSKIPTELAETAYAGDDAHTAACWGGDTGLWAAATGGHEPSWWTTHPIFDAMSFKQVIKNEPCEYEYKTTKEATATQAGERVGTCKVCGHVKTEATAPKLVPINSAVVNGITSRTYTGQAQTQSVVVTLGGKELVAGTDYKVSYANNVNAGSAKLTVAGIGSYTGSVTKSFTINKVAPAAKAKKASVAIKLKKVKKKAQTVKNLSVGNAGKVSYKSACTGKTKKWKVNAKTGAVTVPKGAKKGTYTVKVKVACKADANHEALAKKVTFKVKVK